MCSATPLPARPPATAPTVPPITPPTGPPTAVPIAAPAKPPPAAPTPVPTGWEPGAPVIGSGLEPLPFGVPWSLSSLRSVLSRRRSSLVRVSRCWSFIPCSSHGGGEIAACRVKEEQVRCRRRSGAEQREASALQESLGLGSRQRRRQQEALREIAAQTL